MNHENDAEDEEQGLSENATRLVLEENEDDMEDELNLFDIEKMCEIHYLLPNEEIISLIESYVLEFLFKLIENDEKNGQDLILNYSFGTRDSNQSNGERLHQIIKSKSGTFEKKSLKNNHLKKNHLVWLLMKDVHLLLNCRKKITQRELFYMNVTTFRDQIQCNRCLSTVGDVLKVDRSLLNIICMSKGFIYSNDGRGNSLLSLNGNKQASVESIPGDFPSIDYFGNVDTVLIIEKDAIFRRLVEDKIFKLVRNCLLITGCGYPSIVTRYVVKHVSTRFPNARLYALCDFNIFGYQIMSTYKYGSVEMSRHKVQQESALKDRLQWLGMNYEDVKDIPHYYNQPISQREINLIDLKGLNFLSTYLAKKISKFNIVK
ncbi:predicted protein [Naegleria gruberi]|uniref:DNA topoisomerase (ATP-hydrolyzing) n=1 Tax=Naegleria gruberi TaxID=5762 RepID=D2VU03_NAEGR|nr:uncharacterized protein NAEGRDRAFT_81222 [Naegleria gruberi]EFC39811.1 predicted protein [Naegleria gruberi]|eukprot:XP_002672555.1 predicted protein [Naegleria gruberi strain NEG-M]